ncbi:MAG: DUF542 domain-containing protein [Deltaproteobacteria bacterium]|nr:DUF542 domain-containing protein [Deltaproteobacteria bacterium]
MKTMTVNDVIRQCPVTIGVFTQYHIDSCCGGAVSIEEAARRDGAELEGLLDALNEATAKGGR